MAPANPLAILFLRFAESLRTLRRIPVIGELLSWASRKLLPIDSLVWTQIQDGAAKGLWIRVNPRTGNNVRDGAGEPQVQKALLDHLRLGMTFYDLGANIGFFSLIAARQVGPSGRVFSFEADPETAARLRDNLAYNLFAQAAVEQLAVWSSPGIVSFARADSDMSPDRGLGHVAPGASAGAVTITVEAVSLDSYVRSHTAPDFIKCDVEGGETAVFQGAAQLLAERHPILLVEMHSEENRRNLCQQFIDLGYECRELDQNHVLALPR